MKVNKIFKNILKNTYVLYGVLFVALTNILGYMSHHNYEAVILFALVGFLTQYFSNNMIIILLAPIVFTAVFTLLRQNVREGLGDPPNDKAPNDKAVSTKPEPDSKDVSLDCSIGTETTCSDISGCSWGSKLGQPATCNSQIGMTTLHPKWIKDDEKTEKDFYKNLPEDVDDLGIQEMTKRTEDLAKNQQNLRDTMTKMRPMMDQAQNILSNIDTGAMKKMMDMAESITSPFQKKS
jgi:hypothetical protein